MDWNQQRPPPFLDLTGFEIADDAIQQLPRIIAKPWQILPLSYTDEVVTIGMANSEKLPELHEHLTKCFPSQLFDYRLVDESKLVEWIQCYYGSDEDFVVNVTPL